jgi:hypothetical protein
VEGGSSDAFGAVAGVVENGAVAGVERQDVEGAPSGEIEDVQEAAAKEHGVLEVEVEVEVAVAEKLVA